MDQWKGKVALVTGTSSGIGVAIAEALVKAGMTVIGCARRFQLVEDLACQLRGHEGKVIPRQLDIAKEEEVVATFEWVDSEFGGVDVLINNAGYLGNSPIPEIPMEEIRASYDTNVVGLTLCCREALKSMKRRGMKDGHIININSTLGYRVPRMQGVSLGIYPATKYAVSATCELLRGEVGALGFSTKITSLNPGLVKTGLSSVVQTKYAGVPTINPEDVAKAAVFVLSMPPHVEITNLTIQPTGEPF